MEISENSPLRETLWQGCVLAAVVHAVAVARYPMLSNEHSWDGPNYSVQDSSGTRGTLTFKKDQLVGAIFDVNSSNNPFLSKLDYDVQNILRPAPIQVQQLAEEEALQYLLDDYKGRSVPVVTAFFWSDGERLTAAEPWQTIIKQGAHVIHIQSLATDEGLAAWQHNYELSPQEVDISLRLYEQKRVAFDAPIKMRLEDKRVMERTADEDGMEEARASLKELNIQMP